MPRLTFSKRKQKLTLYIPLLQPATRSDQQPERSPPAGPSSHTAQRPPGLPAGADPQPVPVEVETILGEIPSLDWATSQRPAVVTKPLVNWDGYRQHRRLAVDSKAPLGL